MYMICQKGITRHACEERAEVHCNPYAVHRIRKIDSRNVLCGFLSDFGTSNTDLRFIVSRILQL